MNKELEKIRDKKLKTVTNQNTVKK